MKPAHVVFTTLIGAVTLFGWESLSNTALPWHQSTYRAFADSSRVVETIRSIAPTNGMYVDTRGVVAAVSFAPDARDKSALLGLMLSRQFGLDVVIALVIMLAMRLFPRATTLQYALGAGCCALAVSLAVFASDWNWYGFGAGWAMVNTVDRVLGFTLVGLTMGGLFNRWSDRVRTDEWGGVKAPSGLPSTVGGPTTGARA